MILLIIMCVIGQIIGIGSAIYYWNDQNKDSIDIFYMLTTYWFAIPLGVMLLGPIVVFVLLPSELIKLIRNVD